MKIAYDAKRFFQNTSGLGNYSRDLVRILATYFPENSYVLFNKKKTDKGKEILSLASVFFQKISKGWLARQLHMGTDAQNADVDIFHGLSGELPLKWNKKPIKKIVSIHDLIFVRYPEFYSFFDRKIHFWKFKKACESADLVIAISEQTKRDIIDFLKISESKIRVVYQGCHHAFKESFDENLAQELSLKHQLPERFILNVGTIEERKNLLNIVKAIDGTGIPLVVVGKKTKYFEKVKNYILKNKLQKQVYVLENISIAELATLYKMADIFVYPSLFEGFGIPIIEALFSKTPVITSNISCLPEAGGPNSMYVNPMDFADLKSKITFLWDNESERKRRAEKSFEFTQKFSDQSIAKDLMKVYREILNK